MFQTIPCCVHWVVKAIRQRSEKIVLLYLLEIGGGGNASIRFQGFCSLIFEKKNLKTSYTNEVNTPKTQCKAMEDQFIGLQPKKTEGFFYHTNYPKTPSEVDN